MELTKNHVEILQHALGADEYGRIPRDGRNYFCAGESDESACRELVAAGLMKQHRTTELFPYFNCSVTDAGKQAMKDASPVPPKLTRSKQRYQRFLNADLDISFREFLELEKRERTCAL